MKHPDTIDDIISDSSALYYWRTHSEGLGSVYAPAKMQPSKRCVPKVEAPSKASVETIAHLALAPSEDVHLLVTNQESRRHIPGAHCTVCSAPLPKNSLARALGNHYVVCPELLFVQLAHQLELFELLEIGHELCGTYRMLEGGPEYGADPLTSVAALKAYAQRATDLRGQRGALRAVQWLADGSASPAETALSIMFRLPYREGGYGLGQPLLNYCLELNETAAALLGRSTIRPDQFWLEANHPAEYDGTLYHSGREQAEYDARRRNAYAAMGMAVTVIRPNHLCNINLLDEIANSIRKNTGIRQNRLPASYPAKHAELFNSLFSYWISRSSAANGPDEYALDAARYAAPDAPW